MVGERNASLLLDGTQVTVQILMKVFLVIPHNISLAKEIDLVEDLTICKHMLLNRGTATLVSGSQLIDDPASNLLEVTYQCTLPSDRTLF